MHSVRFFDLALLLLLALFVVTQPCQSAWANGEVWRKSSCGGPWRSSTWTKTTTKSRSVALQSSSKVYFERVVDMPPSGSELQAKMKIEPLLSVPSEIIEVRYRLPFDLNVEPRNNLAVCTKDGPGGEKQGDVLRFTSAWTLGLPQGEGLMASAAAFAGGVSWRCSMFDVMKAKSWGQVVEALTSNLPIRTDEVVMLFERPLSDNSQ